MGQIIAEFRKRFVSDYNLPIQVLESPFFEERLEQCEELYHSKTKYEELLAYINEYFGGNIGKFINEFYAIRDIIIKDLLSKESYQIFNTSDMNCYKLSGQYPKKNLYAEDMKQKLILCIDLKKANFQALKYVNKNIVNNAETYEDFIGGYSNIPYFIESKYNRQVIFGKLNPSRQITVERFLLEKVHKIILEMMKLDFELFNFCNDELMYFANNDIQPHFMERFEKDIPLLVETELGIMVKATFIMVEPIKFLMGNGQTLTIFKKNNMLDGKFKLMTCPVTYMPQVLRLLKGEEITEHDRAFMYENNLAYLAVPLILKQHPL